MSSQVTSTPRDADSKTDEEWLQWLNQDGKDVVAIKFLEKWISVSDGSGLSDVVLLGLPCMRQFAARIRDDAPRTGRNVMTKVEKLRALIVDVFKKHMGERNCPGVDTALITDFRPIFKALIELQDAAKLRAHVGHVGNFGGTSTGSASAIPALGLVSIELGATGIDAKVSRVSNVIAVSRMSDAYAARVEQTTIDILEEGRELLAIAPDTVQFLDDIRSDLRSRVTFARHLSAHMTRRPRRIQLMADEDPLDDTFLIAAMGHLMP